MKKYFSKEYASKRLWVALIVFILFSLFFWLKDHFYSGHAEQVFLQNLELNLSENDESEILIKDIEEGEWNKVCISSSDSLGHYISEGITYNKNDQQKIEDTRLALVFFKEKKLVKIYDFKRYNELNIKNKIILFSGRFEINACAEKSNALFKIIKSNDQSYLLFMPKL